MRTPGPITAFGADDRAGADLRARADHRARIDRDTLLQPRLRMDMGTRRNTPVAEREAGAHGLGMHSGREAPHRRGRDRG